MILFLCYSFLWTLFFFRYKKLDHLRVPLHFAYSLVNQCQKVSSPPAYARIFLELQRSGKPVHASAFSLYRILLGLDLQSKDAAGLYTSFVSKMIAMLCLASLGRLAAFLYFHDSRILTFVNGSDLTLQLIVLWCCTLPCALVHYVLHHAEGSQILSIESLHDFCYAMLLDKKPQTKETRNGFCVAWDSLFKEELRQGITLRELRIAHCENRAALAYQDNKNRLRHIEAWLPFIDMVVGGTIVTTFLLTLADLMV